MPRRLTAEVARCLNADAPAVRLDLDERASVGRETSSDEFQVIPLDGYNPSDAFALVRIVRRGVSNITTHASIEAAMEAAARDYELTNAGWSTATDETSGWRLVEPGVLEQELLPLLRARGARCTVERTLAFADLAWDGDASIEELLQRDWGLTIASTTGGQRIVVQRIRGQLRYWLTTNEAGEDREDELGWVNDLEDAASLCVELLDGAKEVLRLKTPRVVGGKLRGVQSSTPR